MARRALGISAAAFKLAAQRLVAKRRLCMPRRGFFVIIPLEYASVGATPPSWFIDELMKFHDAAYYVGLLSAAALHGAAHQQAQEFQVVTDQLLRPTTAGRARLRFFQKRTVAATPITELRTETGTMRVSTPEATAFDLVRYADSIGGLNSIATVLGELGEKLDTRRLAKVAENVELGVVQRTAFLLERLGHSAKLGSTARWVASNHPRPVLLGHRNGITTAVADARWHVVENEVVEADE
ncbi:MAG: type IV toxin-antitoxin system AbiEi family antitoxin [Sandaracinaceae bacterium]|nr:type IV toxin-antitoxin system AbiEi family antitoxin [Sandaracinaceae bacterium]